jgi:hypothetical protein
MQGDTPRQDTAAVATALLRDPGPTRSRAVTAVASELKMSLGVCGDRCQAIAGRVLDRVADSIEAPA